MQVKESRKLGNIQIYLVFRTIITTFAPDKNHIIYNKVYGTEK